MGRSHTLRQILLVTDGQSNCGCSPIKAAAQAKKRNIHVNVIGIGGRKPLSRRAALEIEAIARAGGGLNRCVQKERVLSALRDVTDEGTAVAIRRLAEAAIHKRATHRRVNRYLEQVEAGSQLEVLVLVDTSASMLKKITAVTAALNDFSVYLRSRRAESRFSVYTYPAADDSSVIVERQPWTSQPDRLFAWLDGLKVRGVTPTGPAILSAVQKFYVGNGTILIFPWK